MGEQQPGASKREILWPACGWMPSNTSIKRLEFKFHWLKAGATTTRPFKFHLEGFTEKGNCLGFGTHFHPNSFHFFFKSNVLTDNFTRAHSVYELYPQLSPGSPLQLFLSSCLYVLFWDPPSSLTGAICVTTEPPIRAWWAQQCACY